MKYKGKKKVQGVTLQEEHSSLWKEKSFFPPFLKEWKQICSSEDWQKNMGINTLLLQ